VNLLVCAQDYKCVEITGLWDVTMVEVCRFAVGSCCLHYQGRSMSGGATLQGRCVTLMPAFCKFGMPSTTLHGFTFWKMTIFIALRETELSKDVWLVLGNKLMVL
jgi:hypothetical protein